HLSEKATMANSNSTAHSHSVRRLARRCKPTGLARRLLLEGLEDRAMMTTLGAGDLAFTGYQGSTTDKLSFVLLKDVTSPTVFTITDNAWSGSALTTNEGNDTITLSANFSAGTHFNFDFSRTAGSRWAVGASTAGISDSLTSNFALNASGD